MNLQTAFNAAKSALIANAAQTAIASRNVAGASDPSYARRLTLVETNGYGGVWAGGVERATDLALRNSALSAQSASATDDALSKALDALQQTIGDTANGQSPAAKIAALNSALIQAASAPQDRTSLVAAVDAAKQLANALNSASATVQAVRSQADKDISAGVEKINSLLSEFGRVNSAIVSGRKAGADVSDALDRRDAILSDLSSQIGIATVSGADGDTAIYTDSGATLFQGGARDVTFKASGQLAPGVSGNAVFVDGVAITGPSASMPVHAGALAGASEIRDVIGTQYQAQLDETARGLIGAFEQTDQSASPSLPDRTGLLTWSGGPATPGAATPGLAAQIHVDPSVDSSAGGDPTLLRDGGIGAAGSAYIYNPSGAPSYSGRLTGLSDALGLGRSFDSRAGLQGSASVTDFATASVGWLEARRQSASDSATQSSAMATRASAALSNATGVNIDDQMSQMLDLENSYQASAKMMATVDAMYTNLFNALAISP